jgi:hypothetical protein
MESHARVRSWRGRVYSTPWWAVSVLSLLVLTPWLAAAQDRSSVSEELKALYEADQADRQFTSPPTDEDWKAISARDSQRQARVYELFRGDRLSAAEDFYHAAMVLQHGDSAEDILVAHILATAAAFRGDERGYWLSAASLDRYLLRTRMPQRLGTQYVKASAEDPFDIDSSQPWSQGPYVRWLPDSIREVFGVESLSDQAQRVREMNASGIR